MNPGLQANLLLNHFTSISIQSDGEAITAKAVGFGIY